MNAQKEIQVINLTIEKESKRKKFRFVTEQG